MSTQTQERRTYPAIPAKAWWAVRRRFQQAVPARVDSGYLQQVLNVREGHATNLVPAFRAVGLVDDSGKPTPLANEWRSDEDYATACQKMLKAIYPGSLTDAVPPSEKDKDAARRWFSRELQVGEAAASKMAAFYVLLAEADPSVETTSKATAARPVTPAAKRAGASTTTRERKERAPDPSRRIDPPGSPDPSLHIDIQVHIPSDASPEQIESIFSSMAKHLYRRS